MALKIVWQNPFLLIKDKLQRIGSEQCGAVYAVSSQDFARGFEVIPGEVALNSHVDSCSSGEGRC
jgi:hypothetical protein